MGFRYGNRGFSLAGSRTISALAFPSSRRATTG
jgi:hypothetical protein